MNIKHFEELVGKVSWRFAKTYMSAPHEYTIFPRELLDDFFAFYQYIDAHGYSETVFGREYKYLNIGDYKYWSMMTPAHNKEEMILINRTLIDNALLDGFRAKYKTAADLPANFRLEMLLTSNSDV